MIDFGLAKTGQSRWRRIKKPDLDGSFLATPHFASPEQLEERDIDARSDIYSLGATIYYSSPAVLRYRFGGSNHEPASLQAGPDRPSANFPASFANLILWMMGKGSRKKTAKRCRTPAGHAALSP